MFLEKNQNKTKQLQQRKSEISSQFLHQVPKRFRFNAGGKHYSTTEGNNSTTNNWLDDKSVTCKRYLNCLQTWIGEFV